MISKSTAANWQGNDISRVGLGLPHHHISAAALEETQASQELTQALLHAQQSETGGQERLLLLTKHARVVALFEEGGGETRCQMGFPAHVHQLTGLKLHL